MKWSRISLILLVLLSSACKQTSDINRETFLAMGGIPVEIIAYGLSPQSLKQATDSAIQDVETWESELGR